MKLQWSGSKNINGEETFVAQAGDVELCVEYDSPSEHNDGVSSGWWWYLDGMSESSEENYDHMMTKEQAMETAEAFVESSAKQMLKSFGYTV
jgi:hypothetical protein